MKPNPCALSCLLVFSLLVLACSRPEEPEFVQMKNLTVDEFTEELVTISGAAILYNPNSFAITVKEIDVEVKVNDQAVGKAKQIGEVKVPPKAQFEVPMNASFAPEEVYDNLLSGLINYIMKGEFDVYYKGHIKIKVSGIVFNVPVDHKATVKI